jgi:hypothetical protein
VIEECGEDRSIASRSVKKFAFESCDIKGRMVIKNTMIIMKSSRILILNNENPNFVFLFQESFIEYFFFNSASMYMNEKMLVIKLINK